MSDEPSDKELAEAAALARGLDGAALEAGQEPPHDALEVAALLRIAQPSAALHADRRDAVLAQVLEPTTLARAPARAKRTRWLWGGMGVASSLAVAALALLVLRKSVLHQEAPSVSTAAERSPSAPPLPAAAPVTRPEPERPTITEVPLSAAEPALALHDADRSAPARRERATSVQQRGSQPRAAPAAQAKSDDSPAPEAKRSSPPAAVPTAELPIEELAGLGADSEPAGFARGPADSYRKQTAPAPIEVDDSDPLSGDLGGPSPAAKAASPGARATSERSANFGSTEQDVRARADATRRLLGLQDAVRAAHGAVRGSAPSGANVSKTRVDYARLRSQLQAAEAEYRKGLLRQLGATELLQAHERADGAADTGGSARAIRALEAALQAAQRAHIAPEAQQDVLLRLATLALEAADAASAQRYATRGLALTRANNPTVVSLWLARAAAEEAQGDQTSAAESIERASQVLRLVRVGR